MSFELKSCHPSVRLLLLALVTFGALAGAQINAQTTGDAILHVCLKGNDGMDIMGAKVVRTGGSKGDVTLLPSDGESGCYKSKEAIPFGITKDYSLQISATGYEPKNEKLDLSPITKDNNFTIGDDKTFKLENPIILVKAGSPAPSPTPTPTPAPANTAQSDWKTMALVAAGVNLLFILLGGLILFLLLRRNSDGQLPAGATATGVGSSLAVPLQNLSKPLKGIQEQQVEQTKILKEMLAEFKNGKGKTRGAGGGDASGASRKKEQPQPSNPLARAAEVPAAAVHLPGEELAKQSYASFLRGQKVSPEPIFVSAEGGSSIMDTFGPKPVVLEENPQGAIVLFRNADDDENGWLYPNTGLHYRQETLRKVFPNLKEDTFEFIKQNKSPDGSNVAPVPVTRLDSSRWQVASS